MSLRTSNTTSGNGRGEWRSMRKIGELSIIYQPWVGDPRHPCRKSPTPQQRVLVHPRWAPRPAITSVIARSLSSPRWPETLDVRTGLRCPVVRAVFDGARDAGAAPHRQFAQPSVAEHFDHEASLPGSSPAQLDRVQIPNE